jgi:phosphonate transport system substrate-binding protein
LRIGTYLAPNILPVYELVTDEITRRLGMPAELVVETDYESCKRDENDVCFVCSLPYVMFERQGIAPSEPVAAPVLHGERYAGAPVYFSDVIVHRDSPFRSFEDLRGRSWSYNEPLSHSGYGITRYHLLRMGETSGFFGEVVEAGFHEESIRMVANAEVDASAIDSQVLAVAMRDDADVRRSLRVIDTLVPRRSSRSRCPSGFRRTSARTSGAYCSRSATIRRAGSDSMPASWIGSCRSTHPPTTTSG